MGGAWDDAGRKPVPPCAASGANRLQKLGIPWIVEILEKSGLAATFFVETFMEDQGNPGGENASADTSSTMAKTCNCTSIRSIGTMASSSAACRRPSSTTSPT